MKKNLLSIAMLFAFACSASAASLTWKTSNVQFDGSALKNNESVSAYLIYLSSGTLATSYDISAATDADSVAAAVGKVVDTKSKSGATGSMSQTWSWTIPDTGLDPSTGAYGAGDVFTVLLAYEKEGTTYYNLSSATYAIAGITDNRGTETMSPSMAFTYSDGGSSSTIKGGGGWTVAVPEPSTAALALAGLALLLKRRKA